MQSTGSYMSASDRLETHTYVTCIQRWEQRIVTGSVHSRQASWSAS